MYTVHNLTYQATILNTYIMNDAPTEVAAQDPPNENDDEAELVDDDLEMTRIAAALARLNTNAGGADTATYNGHVVTTAQAEVLKALLDLFEYSCTYDGTYTPPDVGLTFSRLPISVNNPALNPRPGYTRFYAAPSYDYKVGSHSAPMPFVMVEKVIVDLRRKTTSEGRPVSRYGTGWVNVAIPIAAFRAICQPFVDKGYQIDDSGFKTTVDGEYVTTVCSITESKPPEFTMVVSEEDRFMKYRLGSVADAYTSGDINDLTIGYVGLTPGFTAEVTEDVSAITTEHPVKLKMKLGVCRIFGRAPAHNTSYFVLGSPFSYPV